MLFQLKKLIRWLLKGITLVVILALVASVCLWFYGGYLGFGSVRPFDGIFGRVVGITVIWAIAILVIALIVVRRRARDKEMTEEIVEAVDTSDDLVSGELGDVRGKLRTALTQLRKSKFGRRSLYELPWYVIIGPPGAGKTTAIVNSGLNFPLADSMGKEAIGGVGGTRNCDWWFTDSAVLIDTAGRYTTQDSDAEADNAGWLGFLDLLKKHRKRQPINGALIAISVSDLSMQDEETRASHARAVRRRLHELRERLGVRFPVYVLFTKADLIAGFSEFYEPLGKEDRGQVWGFTLPLPKGKDQTAPTAAFDEEFGALLGRLNAQTLGKMQSETDPQRRALIAGFPGQVASVRQVARDFLNEAFQENKYETRQLLRGVYFTSGTQEGTPIDRLMMGMARTFGIGRQAIGSGRGSGRSYFLTRLFDNVIFREAGLVSADDKVERRYRWSLRAAVAATILIAITAGALWTRSFLGNDALIAEASASTQQFITEAAAIPPSPVGDTDFPAIVPALNTLRTMPTNPAGGEVEVAAKDRWGLYQGDVIGDQAAQSYRAALNQHLLPRLLLQLEEQMQSAMNEPDLLYDTLKIYLMLGQQGPLNADLVMETFASDWEQLYPGLSRTELRADLAMHLESLLTQPMKTVALNGPLVEQVRGILRQMPMAQRIYTGILNSPEVTSLPDFRISDVGGANINRVMTRSSGKPLTEGIPGIFTHRGFRSTFLPEAVGVASQIQSEAFVLGDEAAAEQTPEALAATARDVLDLYYTDFIAEYDSLLAEIDIVPLQSLSQAAEVANVLSGPTSPIRNILSAVAQETRLTEPLAPDSAAGVVGELAGGVGGAAGGLAFNEFGQNLDPRERVIFDLLASDAVGSATGARSPSAGKPPGAFVQERFSFLHDLVTSEREDQPSQLDEIMQLLTEVYQELNKLAFAGGLAGQQQDQVSALAQFQQAAARIPGPMERWATQLAVGSSGITADGTRAQLNQLWQSQVLPFCTEALSNRYPFTRRAAGEVKIADFARLFAPEGMIQSFFDQNLRDHVDTSVRPWRFREVNGVDLGISDAVLVQFQNASEIRDTFFAGGATPAITFDITPEALDPKAESVSLEVDGQTVGFQHRGGPPTPVKMTWPGPASFARVIFQPADRGTENALSRDGDWAFFRLLDAAEVRKTNVSDRNRVIFNVGGRIAIFQLRAGSVLNPFSLPALSRFQCPESF